MLVGSLADINAKGPFGETALIAAAFNSHEPVVKVLVSKGADVAAVDDDGRDAADRAATEAIRLLLRPKPAA